MGQDNMIRLNLSGLTVHSANFIPDDHDAWRVRAHSNPHWQLVLAKGCDLHFQKGNVRLLLQNGHILMLHPNETHRSWGAHPTQSGFFYVQFSVDDPHGRPASNARPFRREDEIHDSSSITLPTYGKCNHPALFALFSELVDEVWNRPPFYKSHAAAIVTKLLVAVARDTVSFETGSNPLNVRSPHEAQVVSSVKKFLEENFQEKLSSSIISRHVGYNYSYLSRLFSRAIGMTITDYVHYLRIENARVLLLEMRPKGSIRDIAEMVGYTDPSYFGRIFRRYEGVSPRDYIKSVYGRPNVADPEIGSSVKTS